MKHFAHTQALTFASSGSALISSGVNTLSIHQQRSKGLPADLATSIAHIFALPQRGQIAGLKAFIPGSYLWFNIWARVPHQEAKSAKICTSSREWLTHRQPAHPSKVATAKARCGLTGNQAGISPLDEGFFDGWICSCLPHPDIRQSG